jgi:hypothetical protein
MINGRMRSHHIADKLGMSTSWTMLPSRAFSKIARFSETTGESVAANALEYTVDGGAGGVEILDWYRQHPGSFWVFLSYDNYLNFGETDQAYDNLNKYSEVVEVFFSDFSYTVNKRGGSNHDLWDISVSLEEV